MGIEYSCCPHGYTISSREMVCECTYKYHREKGSEIDGLCPNRISLFVDTRRLDWVLNSA